MGDLVAPSSRDRGHPGTISHERSESNSALPHSGRQRRGSSQKTMLSRALQKANTAVLLDNATNFEGAIEAYNDACELLQYVMLRSNGGDVERHKLQEIRKTYLTRIQELQRLHLPPNNYGDKALPERPPSGHSSALQEDKSPIDDGFEYSGLDEAIDGEEFDNKPHVSELKTTRSSFLPDGKLSNLSFDDSNMDTNRITMAREGDELPERFISSSHKNFASDTDISYHDKEIRSTTAHEYYSSEGQIPANDNQQSTSWLDIIDESGASSPGSTHTRLSLFLDGTHSHHASNGTEAEFDAALDAAVEAAYDQGLEPALNQPENFYDDEEEDEYQEDDNDDNAGDNSSDHNDVVSVAKRNIEIAKQRVREAEREAQAVMIQRLQQRRMLHEEAAMDPNYNPDMEDEEAEEEERLLEEMTKGYVKDDFQFNLHSKSALPRQSDSNTVSGKTLGGSLTTSNSATTGTSLSTLAEEGVFLSSDDAPASHHLPPVPKIPLEISTGSAQPIPASMSPSATVRARRFSGSNMKQLKIDTKRIPPSFEPSKPFSAQVAGPSSPTAILQSEQPKTSLPILSRSKSPFERKDSYDVFGGEQYNSDLTKVSTRDDDGVQRSAPSSPPRTSNKITSSSSILRKNTSSSSLAGMRARNVSVSTHDIPNDSPNTPSSSLFPAFDFQRHLPNGIVPVLPTPSGGMFPSKKLHLFDHDIHSPTTPGSPNTTAANAPIPLEPCPESFLLRPFWLMRCLYQTIAHPRGGYVSTKLFIPKEIWQVKNVKIRAMEDKISLCDLLTAALLKVAQVDTYDADAILEEMQSFENILDQAQTTFAKKLSNEVGVQGALPLFKNANSSEEFSIPSDGTSSRNSNYPSRSYLSSWRKLRSKSSTATNSSAASSTIRDSGKGGLSMSTLPMTGSPPSLRFTKRNVAQLQLSGPNANYMGALARLFDAVQVLDQIARQVEDPGLKHSSPTHVGLELSTRHAAEFFGFYVCRFALNDVGMLLDKYIKRGTEWVLL